MFIIDMMQGPEITFIATCHNEQNEVYLFCSAMRLQKNPNWKAIIVCNGRNSLIHNAMQDWMKADDRFSYMSTEVDTGFWGCYNRIAALDHVTTEYVVNTSIQDYYLPCAVGDILFHAGKDIIYWNCLHNHKQWNMLDSRLAYCEIDWGSFAVKTDIIKAVGINKPEEPTADGTFIVDALAAGYQNNNKKIEKVLTIHN